MMFGNVAPAPLSWTCAAAGRAAPSKPARARNRVDFMSVCSPWMPLERELRLEVELRPRRLLQRRWGALIGEQIEIGEQPQVGRQLIGCSTDEPRQPIVRQVGVGIVNIHAGEYRRLRVGEVVHTEEAGD